MSTDILSVSEDRGKHRPSVQEIASLLAASNLQWASLRDLQHAAIATGDPQCSWE